MVSGIVFYILKFADRVWDKIDEAGIRKIESDVEYLEQRNKDARLMGDVEVMNATRAALDEINRKLRAIDRKPITRVQSHD